MGRDARTASTRAPPGGLVHHSAARAPRQPCLTSGPQIPPTCLAGGGATGGAEPLPMHAALQRHRSCASECVQTKESLGRGRRRRPWPTHPPATTVVPDARRCCRFVVPSHASRRGGAPPAGNPPAPLCAHLHAHEVARPPPPRMNAAAVCKGPPRPALPGLRRGGTPDAPGLDTPPTGALHDGVRECVTHPHSPPPSTPKETVGGGGQWPPLYPRRRWLPGGFTPFCTLPSPPSPRPFHNLLESPYGLRAFPSVPPHHRRHPS